MAARIGNIYSPGCTPGTLGGGGLVAKPCLTLCNPMDCSPLGCSVYGISQAKILEWVVISLSKGSSQSRDRTHVSCLAGGFFTTKPLGALHLNLASTYEVETVRILFH